MMNARMGVSRGQLMLWCWLAGIAAALPNPVAFAADSVRSSTSRASAASLDAIYRRAKLAYDADRFEDCKRIIREATEITPVMLVLLAQAECELHQFKACAMHAAESLKSPEHRPDKRVAIEEILADAAREVGVLVLTVNIGGAEVFIDGQLVGTSPIDTPIYVEPGAHRLNVKRVGQATVAHQIAVQKGGTLQLDVVLHDSTVPARDDDLSGLASARALPVRVERVAFELDASPRTPQGPSVAALLTGGAIALGGLTAGLYFNARSSSDFERADRLKRDLEPGTCARDDVAMRTSCSDLKGALDSGDRARNYSTLGFVVGSAAVLGTAVYWLWPRSGETRPGVEHSRLSGVILPGGGWVTLQNEF
ncbi:MAG TPA: PEGA domain-containing protein [Polyangiaceae bacterium]